MVQYKSLCSQKDWALNLSSSYPILFEKFPVIYDIRQSFHFMMEGEQ